MGSTGPYGLRRWASGLAIAAMGLLSACGGNDADQGRDQPRHLGEDGSKAATATDGDAAQSEAPADAYAAWLDALTRHDAETACTLQAPELTIALRYQAVLVDRAELGDPCPGFEALLWEDPAFDGEIVDVEVTQQTAEDALLDVQLASTDLTVRMVRHRAHWRVFSTADRAPDGSDRSDGADGRSGPARWLAAWCSLSPDQTRDQVIGLMGEPSGEYTVADGGEPQLWWAQHQYDFRVYLDPVDPASVLELVGDYDRLSAEDRALLPCPELRR